MKGPAASDQTHGVCINPRGAVCEGSYGINCSFRQDRHARNCQRKYFYPLSALRQNKDSAMATRQSIRPRVPSIHILQGISFTSCAFLGGRITTRSVLQVRQWTSLGRKGFTRLAWRAKRTCKNKTTRPLLASESIHAKLGSGRSSPHVPVVREAYVRSIIAERRTLAHITQTSFD